MDHLEALNDLHFNDNLILQHPAVSPDDSDYFSEGERDSPVDDGLRENTRPTNPTAFSASDDWIELDLSVQAQRLLSGSVVTFCLNLDRVKFRFLF